MVAKQAFAQGGAAGERPPAPPALALLASVAPGQLGPMRKAALSTDRAYALDVETVARVYFHGASRELVADVTARLVGESPSVMNDFSIGAGIPVAKEDLRCPVLVMSAAHDGTLVPKDDRIARHLGADYRCVEVGHDIMLDEGREDALAVLLEWLEQRLAKPARKP